MRRVFSFIVFLVLMLSVFCYLFTVPVLADSASALADYNKQYDLYRQNYSSYVTSKNKWLTYRTLDSNQGALINGKIFLKQRITVVTAYLNLLKERVAQSNGFSQEVKNLIFSKLNVEQTWLNDHILKYDSTATLNDLEQLSGQFEDRYASVIQYISLATAGEIISNKEAVLNSRLLDIINRLGQKLPEISGSGQDITIAQRWLLQAQNKQELAQSKQDDSLTLLNLLRGVNPVAQYNQALFNLSESNQYLKEAVSYLTEVVKNITGE